MPTGADALVAGLESLGVEVVFGLPGVHNLAAWKSLSRSGIRLVGVRHEQTAAYAADGYARATGRLGVAITTTGPGAANAVAATGEAWTCHSPVLVIATDVPTTARRPGEYRGVLHETTDQASFFRPVTKEQLRAHTAGELHDLVRIAGEIALAAPRRPVYLEVPTDLLSAAVGDAESPGTWEMPAAPEAPPTAPDLTSERPLLWIGGGAVDQGDLVAELAERLGAPVLTSYGGRGVLPPDSPHLVPLPPAMPEAGALWDAADLVIVVGSDLDAMNTQGFRQPRPPRLIAVDLVAPVTYPPDHWVEADAADGLRLLIDAAGERREPWMAIPQRALTGPEGDFVHAVEAALPPDAVVVADMCVPGYWYGAFGRVGARGLAYPVGWGTLGFGFPASLGSCLSGRPTLAIVGDGGFLFACGDLATAAQERLPVTVLLVDDGGYGMLRYDFTKDGEEPVGTELEPPDFVALAQAFRVPAEEVALDGLTEAIERHLSSGGPSMLVLKATFTPPPNSSPNWYRVRQT